MAGIGMACLVVFGLSALMFGANAAAAGYRRLRPLPAAPPEALTGPSVPDGGRGARGIDGVGHPIRAVAECGRRFRRRLSTMTRTVQEEVDLNYEAFQKELPRLLHEHRGKFALLKNGRIMNFFSSAENARNTAASFIPDGLYSIQQVTACRSI